MQEGCRRQHVPTGDRYGMRLQDTARILSSRFSSMQVPGSAARSVFPPTLSLWGQEMLEPH